MKTKTITDKERLDWLDKQDGAITHEEYGEYSYYFESSPSRYSFPTARQVIDEAIQNEKNRNKTTRA